VKVFICGSEKNLKFLFQATFKHRLSSSRNSNEAKSAQILVADPTVVDKVSGSSILCLLRSDQVLIAGTSAGDLIVYPSFGSEPGVPYKNAHNGKVNAVVYCESLDLICTAGEDGAVHMWSWSNKNKKVKKVYSARGVGGVATAMVRLGQHHLVVGYESGELMIWSLTEKDCSLKCSSSHLRTPVFSITVRILMKE
jgi:WD40 repeat protein